MSKAMHKRVLYKTVDPNINFSAIESEILKYWADHKVFQRSVDQRTQKEQFIFYDGPPFANGLPHYGHLLTGFIKDVFARYQTLKGKRVERRFGWDCHGLPAEMAAEKELGISGRKQIQDFGIDKFNAYCHDSVMKYANHWQEYVIRQARWVDFENSYKTMDIGFMESVLWVFKELYKKGLIYRAMKVMPYSWACQTPLANFETRLDNAYRKRADNSITVSFVLRNVPRSLEPYKQDYNEFRLLAWTTTPWTLPSNLALAVKSEMEYVLVPKGCVCYVLGKFALNKYLKEFGDIDAQNLVVIKGSDLAGALYYPMFDYFKDHKNSFKVLCADFVTEEDGTGIVHSAPGFGEEDQLMCQEHGIELVCPVDSAAKFTSEVKDFEGIHVFDANDSIIIHLKQKGYWFKTEQVIRNYPHCWRTDTPLIYKAVPSWYVKVTAIKDRMCTLNQQINWIPGNVKDGLFGNWLQNAKDWSISRKRFWGTPIPIWESDDPKYPRIDVYGSIEALNKDFGVTLTDLHRPDIDNLIRKNPDDPTGKSMMRRIEDVFDCWFESGSMPYGQVHYPFENKEWFETHFPADFIVEYSAQTRGWFYTMMVLSTALFDRPPFLNCICHGVILDLQGQKLSKRLNNYADPLEMFKQYGADALRVTMLSSNVVRGGELLVDKDGKMFYEATRLFIKPIWNAYHFFTLYANSDQMTGKINFNSHNLLDRYILSKLKYTVENIDQALNQFDTISAYSAIERFFEILNNWYIRRSRQRFWKKEIDLDKTNAYDTLYTCLDIMSKAMSPLLPLVSEAIYLGLNTSSVDNSVHLQNFPIVSAIEVDQDLIDRMDQVLDICSTALFIRQVHNLRVRQPLAKILIVTDNGLQLKEFEALIQDEINVKFVEYSDSLSDFANEKLAINFPILAQRLPSKVKEIIAAVKEKSWHIRDQKLYIANEILTNDEFELTLDPKKIDGIRILNSGSGLVVLDLNLSQDLINEGMMRDLVRLIQQARKDAGLDISDMIALSLEGSEEFLDKMTQYKDFIAEQTLCTFDIMPLSKLTSDNKIQDIFSNTVNIDTYEVKINFSLLQ